MPNRHRRDRHGRQPHYQHLHQPWQHGWHRLSEPYFTTVLKKFGANQGANSDLPSKRRYDKSCNQVVTIAPIENSVTAYDFHEFADDLYKTNISVTVFIRLAVIRIMLSRAIATRSFSVQTFRKGPGLVRRLITSNYGCLRINHETVTPLRLHLLQSYR